MNTSRRLRPVRATSSTSANGHGLNFCAVCQVSIASSELESGEARRTPRGRTFCGVCASATPAERARRREELESEFADDAPVAVPAPIQIPVAAPPPLPNERTYEEEILERRVGELERNLFRANARIARLEEKFDEIQKRLG